MTDIDTRRSSSRLRAALSLSALFACTVCSCAGPDALDAGTNNNHNNTTNTNPVDSPVRPSFTVEQLIDAHNDRSAMLRDLHAHGVIEITWADDRGSHTDQGDVELWISQPRRTALRVDKLGEVLLWLGSDETQWWLFDMLSDPTTLHTGSHDIKTTARGDGGALPVHPLVLLDLLGVTAVTAADGAELEYYSDPPGWSLAATGSSAPLRMIYNTSGGLRGVEALDGSGAVIATSALRDERPVKRRGANPVAWPKTATHITITLADRAGKALVALNSDMEAAVDPEQAERIFDVDAIEASLRPERVEAAVAEGE